MKCPFGTHPSHNTSDQQIWVRSKAAMRRHLAVHHQIIYKCIPQPDGNLLPMLIRPTAAELTDEVRRVWTPRKDPTGRFYPCPSCIPGVLPEDPRPFPTPLMSLTLQPASSSSSSFHICHAISVSHKSPPVSYTHLTLPTNREV